MTSKSYATASASSSSSANSTESQQQREWVLVNPRLLVGLIGAATCYAWLFAMLGTSAFFPGADGSEYIVSVGHLAFIVGVIIALLICRVLSNAFSAHRIFELLISVALCACGCAGLGCFPADADLTCAFSCVLGLGFGFLYPLYGEFLSKFFYTAMRNYVNGIFLAAAVICCAFLFAGSGYTNFALGVVFVVISLCVCLFELIAFHADSREVVDKSESDERARVVWRSYLATATSGMTGGFALGCIVSIPTIGDFPWWCYAATLAAVFLTCLVVFADSLKWHRINEAGTMRWFLPCSTVLVFPIIFAPMAVKFALAALLLCFSIIPTVTSIAAICKHISICDLSAIRAFSFGRLMSFLGVLLGMALAFVDFMPFGQAIFGDLTTTVVVVVLMALIIFSASFVMTEDNYPVDARSLSGKEEGAPEGEAAEDPSPHSAIKPIMEKKASAVEAVQEAGDAWHRGGTFYAKCDAVADRYDLSNRQREVLVLLAKGRNADYITEKLVVSPHTSKAHIYNIYQKTGVHSRQELMNLVENTEVEEA